MSRGRFIAFLLGFFALWIAAWVLHENAARFLPIPNASNRAWDTFYWMISRVLIWALFPILCFGARVRDSIRFVGMRRDGLQIGILVGIAVSIVWLVLSSDLVPLRHPQLGSTSDAFVFIDQSAITPVVEEFLFRGYIQGGLIALGMRVYPAIGITTALFVLTHCVGWYFQEVLFANLTSARLLSVMVMSIVLGYLRYRSGSLWASVVLHMSNNAFSFAVTN